MEQDMAGESSTAEQKQRGGDAAPETQASQQTGRREVGLRVDESKLSTHYTNAFRSNVSAEEVVLDFGMNIVQPVSQRDASPGGVVANITFHVDNRLVMNYYTAKRLAMTLSDIVRQHEQQFGELKLNAAERRSSESPETGR
jgi:hypothetical protein